MQFLPKKYAGLIRKETNARSVVQALGTRKETNLSGTSLQSFTVPSIANWVGVKGAKPADEATNTIVEVQTHKLAAIIKVAEELVEQSGPALAREITAQTVAQFSQVFDREVFYGENSLATWNTINETSKRQVVNPADVWGSLVDAVDQVKNGDAFAFSHVVEGILLRAVDGIGRPLFVHQDLSEGSYVLDRNRLIGKKVAWSDNVYSEDAGEDGNEVVGFYGKWENNVIWALYDRLRFARSTEATVDGENAFQHNLVFFRVEGRYAALVLDPEAFVALELAPEGEDGDGGEGDEEEEE